MSKSSKSARDNRANQMNPAHPAYHQSRGASRGEAERAVGDQQAGRDNRANQLNPNHAPTKPDGARVPTDNPSLKKST